VEQLGRRTLLKSLIAGAAGTAVALRARAGFA
jgi:hypothetical protein